MHVSLRIKVGSVHSLHARSQLLTVNCQNKHDASNFEKVLDLFEDLQSVIRATAIEFVYNDDQRRASVNFRPINRYDEFAHISTKPYSRLSPLAVFRKHRSTSPIHERVYFFPDLIKSSLYSFGEAACFILTCPLGLLHSTFKSVADCIFGAIASHLGEAFDHRALE